MSYQFIPRVIASNNLKRSQPLFWFAGLWSLLLFIPVLKILPEVNRPMLFWRVEFSASLFLLVILIFFLWNKSAQKIFPQIHQKELLFLFLPCTAFVAWSGLSGFWAASPLLVAHHTLVWACYLIFFCFMRELVGDSRYKYISVLSLSAFVWILALPCLAEFIFGFALGDLPNLRLLYGRYAEVFITILPVFLALTLRAQARSFYFFAATTILIWAVVLMTTSRAAIILGFTGITLLFIFACLKRPSSRVKKRTVNLFLIFLALTLLAQVSATQLKGSSVLDRFTSQSANHSNNARLLFNAVSLEMIKDNFWFGVGADNYGLRFNEYRAVYGEKSPNDANLQAVEDMLPERAHNEFLQIFAELGLIGIALFAAFLFGIAYLFKISCEPHKNISLQTASALIGVILFLASSSITSFSFRLMQNGLVFFFVLALAIKGFSTVKEIKHEKAENVILQRVKLHFAVFAILICASLATYSLMCAASQYFAEQIRSLKDDERAASVYQTAINLDSNNGSAYLFYGNRLFLTGRSAEAVPYLKKTIENGVGTSAAYSLLASAQTLSGNTLAAEETMAKAARIYPRSVFVRVRYALLLEKNGKRRESAEQLKIAKKLDSEQAHGWFNVITEGAKKAARKSYDEKQATPPMYLFPQNALYVVLDERGLVNPEEKAIANFGF
jgi:O-antigen ligase